MERKARLSAGFFVRKTCDRTYPARVGFWVRDEVRGSALLVVSWLFCSSVCLALVRGFFISGGCMSLDKGQVVVYGGGVGVSGSAYSQSAKVPQELTESISLLQMPVTISSVDVTLGDIVTLGGFAIIVARFVWDVRRSRRAKRE